MKRWFADLGIVVKGRTVCEIGFGAGWCLAELATAADRVFGVEAIPTNIEHATSLGVPAHDLYNTGHLPQLLGASVDFWVYQDSFEHLPDPASHLGWVRANSSTTAQILIVAPEASSRSERLLGPFWPYRTRDHAFHWSTNGLETVLGLYGFVLRRRFSPSKLLSMSTLMGHLANRLGFPIGWPGGLGGLRVWFHLGEQGLLFDRAQP